MKGQGKKLKPSYLQVLILRLHKFRIMLGRLIDNKIPFFLIKLEFYKIVILPGSGWADIKIFVSRK